MQERISCVIVDDDPIDRLTTVSFVRKYPYFKIDGVFENSEDALTTLLNATPDVVFLDIDMPGLTGIQLRDKLRHVPACVFVTSYAEYAVESFEKEAFDFLLKPLKQERFALTVNRLQDYFTLREKAALLDITLGGDTVYVKEGHTQIKLQLHDILYLEALKDYTRIVTPAKKYCVLFSLGNLLKEDKFNSFIRIHRSFAVQKMYVDKVTTSSVFVKSIELPVGRVYKDALADLK